MIKIYFDNVLLDDDNYMSFSYNKKMFDDEFFLGSVASVQADLKIPKSALPSSLNEVKVTIDDEPYLSLVVDEITDEDDDTIDIKLTDRLINTDSPYNFEELVPISAKDLLIAICEEFDIPYDTFSFTNDDVVIDSYDSTVTAREYLSMIAELAGGYIRINNEGKLEIKTYLDNDSLTTITAEDVDDYKLSENITIERISYEFAGEDYSYPHDSDDSLYTIQLNSDNVFLQVATDEQKDALAQNIIGFTFSNIKIDTCNKFDNNNMLFTFKDINNDSYTCLNQYEADYAGAFVGSYESNIHNAKQDFTKTVSQEAKIKRIRQIINQDENYMKLIAESVDKTELTISDQGVMIDVLANHSNIDVSYDSDGKPISGELTEVTTRNKKFKLDSSGFNIEGDEGYKAKYTETGTYYYDGDNPVGQYTKDGSKQKDLALFGTYMYGMNDINDTPMFVGQLYEDDDNEECFGHFYNRGD